MRDKRITLIGGGGFIGRYVAQALLAQGARIRIAQRRPEDARMLQPLGGLGQIQYVALDIRQEESVARAIAGSDAVVNLAGVLRGDLRGVHVEGARHVAAAAARENASALVQLSAIGADTVSVSAYGRSKGEGEIAARAAFPAATMVRPSVIFGREDRFINRFAAMAAAWPIVPVLRPYARFQPVYVVDVARAIVDALQNPDRFGGRIFELGGPEIHTMRGLVAWIAKAIGRDPAIVALSDFEGAMIARLGFLPGAPISWDEWLMLGQGAVARDGVDGLAAFGIAPTPLAPGWLERFRANGRFTSRRV